MVEEDVESLVLLIEEQEFFPLQCWRYFGFQIYMGIVNEPATEDYWRRDRLNFSPIAETISRKCFRDSHRFLHFADNTSHSLIG